MTHRYGEFIASQIGQKCVHIFQNLAKIYVHTTNNIWFCMRRRKMDANHVDVQVYIRIFINICMNMVAELVARLARDPFLSSLSFFFHTHTHTCTQSSHSAEHIVIHTVPSFGSLLLFFFLQSAPVSFY